MKKIAIIVIFALSGWFFSMQQAAAEPGITLIKLGKGGAVFQNGSYKLCPQFSFRKCCKIHIAWSTIWNWITDDGCWDPNVNSNMPVNGYAELYDDSGSVEGNYNVKITWINSNTCAEVNGCSITLEHPDISVEVVD